MELFTIDTGFFKLDGGAMFGVVPKTIWEKSYSPDEKNLCTWAMRCLLIKEGNRLILIDNGIGNKQDSKFFGHYDLHGSENLDDSLKKHGFHRDDITDIFLSHLHFDHCGGSIERNTSGNLVPAFRNARFWSNADHWKWATEPNPREKASFLPENILPIKESGQLEFINEGEELIPGIKVFFSRGHTDAMMHPVIEYKGRKIVFMADLLPSTAHLPLPWIMAYDTRPLISMEEKGRFLKKAAEENYILFLEHDRYHECCTVKDTEKGIRLDETFPLHSI